MGAFLIVLGLFLILTTGILYYFVPLKDDCFYVDTSGSRYMMGMSERSWVLLERTTDLMSLAGFVVLCSYVVWTALLQQPYYYGF